MLGMSADAILSMQTPSNGYYRAGVSGSVYGRIELLAFHAGRAVAARVQIDRRRIQLHKNGGTAAVFNDHELGFNFRSGVRDHHACLVCDCDYW
jgi:hypothetical protein